MNHNPGDNRVTRILRTLYVAASGVLGRLKRAAHRHPQWAVPAATGILGIILLLLLLWQSEAGVALTSSPLPGRDSETAATAIPTAAERRDSDTVPLDSYTSLDSTVTEIAPTADHDAPAVAIEFAAGRSPAEPDWQTVSAGPTTEQRKRPSPNLPFNTPDRGPTAAAPEGHADGLVPSPRSAEKHVRAASPEGRADESDPFSETAPPSRSADALEIDVAVRRLSQEQLATMESGLGLGEIATLASTDRQSGGISSGARFPQTDDGWNVFAASRPEPDAATPAESQPRRISLAASSRTRVAGPGLHLTIHGASQVARGMAASYALEIRNDSTVEVKNVVLNVSLPKHLTHRFGPKLRHPVERLSPGQIHTARLNVAASHTGSGTIEAAVVSGKAERTRRSHPVIVAEPTARRNVSRTASRREATYFESPCHGPVIWRYSGSCW